MKLITNWWEKFKAKSTWQKLLDVFYVAFLITILTPTGRIKLQQGLLELGLFSSTELNENAPLSDASLNWNLTDMSGHAITLKELTGKVIFLNCWSTWCGPCTAEMPNIIKLREQMNDNVVFVFAAHESATTVKKYLDRKEWAIPAYVYQTNPGNELHFGSLPSTFIIDKNGTVVHRSSGVKKWNTQETINLLNGLAEANR